MTSSLIPNLPALAASLDEGSLARELTDACQDAETEDDIRAKLREVLETRLTTAKEQLRDAANQAD